jgi:hypothetical protein
LERDSPNGSAQEYEKRPTILFENTASRCQRNLWLSSALVGILSEAVSRKDF